MIKDEEVELRADIEVREGPDRRDTTTGIDTDEDKKKEEQNMKDDKKASEIELENYAKGFFHKYSWNVAKVRGVYLSMHYTFILYSVLIASQAAWTYGFHKWPYITYIFFCFGPLTLWTAFIHELGHCYMVIKTGGTATRIVLWPFGGITLLDSGGATYIDDMKISFAGPSVHIPLGILFFIPFFILNDYVILPIHEYDSIMRTFVRDLCKWSALVQCIILTYNLVIPLYPADGGQIFATFMLYKGIDPNKAGFISGVCSIPCCISSMVYCGFMVSRGSAFYIQAIFSFTMAFYFMYCAINLLRLSYFGLCHFHPLFGTFRAECRRNEKTKKRRPMNSTIKRDGGTKDEARRVTITRHDNSFVESH